MPLAVSMSSCSFSHILLENDQNDQNYLPITRRWTINNVAGFDATEIKNEPKEGKKSCQMYNKGKKQDAIKEEEYNEKNRIHDHAAICTLNKRDVYVLQIKNDFVEEILQKVMTYDCLHDLQLNYSKEKMKDLIHKHFDELPLRYLLSVTTDDVLNHIRLLYSTRKTNSIAVACNGSAENFQVTVTCPDCPKVLNKIHLAVDRVAEATVEADIITTKSGFVLDRYIIQLNPKYYNAMNLVESEIHQFLSNEGNFNNNSFNSNNNKNINNSYNKYNIKSKILNEQKISVIRGMPRQFYSFDSIINLSTKSNENHAFQPLKNRSNSLPICSCSKIKKDSSDNSPEFKDSCSDNIDNCSSDEDKHGSTIRKIIPRLNLTCFEEEKRDNPTDNNRTNYTTLGLPLESDSSSSFSSTRSSATTSTSSSSSIHTSHSSNRTTSKHSTASARSTTLPATITTSTVPPIPIPPPLPPTVAPPTGNTLTNSPLAHISKFLKNSSTTTTTPSKPIPHRPTASTTNSNTQRIFIGTAPIIPLKPLPRFPITPDLLPPITSNTHPKVKKPFSRITRTTNNEDTHSRSFLHLTQDSISPSSISSITKSIMSTTYRACLKSPDNRVVLLKRPLTKSPHAKSTDFDGYTEEEGNNVILREINLVKNLATHPHICKVIGACATPPNAFICYEFIVGSSLSYLLYNETYQFQYKVFALQVAVGMQFLHQNGILHRDLKSSNIMINEHGQCKIIDFGLSCFLKDSGEHTCETGTYRWMAPEVIKHERYSKPADVYSYGVFLWEMLARVPPYVGMTPIQAAFGVAKNELRPTLPGDTPPRTAALVHRCWHHQALMRPTFKEIIELIPQLGTYRP